MGNASNSNSSSNDKPHIPSDQGSSNGKDAQISTVGQSAATNRPPPPKPEYNPNK